MINRRLLNLIPVLLVALLSCDEASNPANSEFMIISNAGNPLNGIVSIYAYPSQNFEEEAFRFSSTTFPVKVVDADLSDNELSIIKKDDSTEPDKIEVVNISDWTDFRSTDLFLVANFSRLASLNDKIFVAGSAQDGSFHFLVFNKATLAKEDSIFLGDYAEIRTIITHNDKIYISHNNGGGVSFLLILSTLNYAPLDEIELPNISEDLVVDSEGNILAFHKSGFVKINSTTLASTPVTIPQGNVFYGPGGSSFGFDKQKNIVYYFTYAAQPAPAPYHLAAFNLTSNEPIEIEREFMNGSSIDFDNTTGKLIIGTHDTSKGIVNFYKTNGKFIDDFFVPNTPLKIIFK